MASISPSNARRIVTEVAATIVKAGLALFVFGAVFFGFQWASSRQAQAVLASLPLPDETVQNDCAIWFVGSSSMSRWDSLQNDMQPWSTHNRSVGGATLTEINQRFLNERKPQRPQAIVFYAGENDLAFGVPVEVALSRFENFLDAKSARLRDVPVLFVSIKPSPARWDQRSIQSVFNARVNEMAKRRTDLHFVNTVPRLLRGSQPGPYYVGDGLHLNEAGYEVLAAALRTAINNSLPPSVLERCTTPRSRT